MVSESELERLQGLEDGDLEEDTGDRKVDDEVATGDVGDNEDEDADDDEDLDLVEEEALKNASASDYEDDEE